MKKLLVVSAMFVLIPPVGAVPASCFGKATTISSTDPVVIGTAGDDVIVTGKGPQSIFALSGNDRICAGRGHDDIDGGPGVDRGDGGKGRDRCDVEHERRCEGNDERRAR